MRRLRMSLGALATGALVLLLLPAPGRSAQAGKTTIRWFGQASFLIASASGVRIVLDPFHAGVGYPLPHPPADIVTVSHNHPDHNATEEVRGHFAIIRGPGKHEARGIEFRGIPSSHGDGRTASPNGEAVSHHATHSTGSASASLLT